MTDLIKTDKLHELRYNATAAYNEAGGDKVLAEFSERIDKGLRYLASLRDRMKSEEIPAEYIEAAESKLNDLKRERLTFSRTYEFPVKVYSTLFDLANFTTDLGLPKNVEGERPVNAVQIIVGGQKKIELFIDLADNGIPF